MIKVLGRKVEELDKQLQETATKLMSASSLDEKTTYLDRAKMAIQLYQIDAARISDLIFESLQAHESTISRKTILEMCLQAGTNPATIEALKQLIEQVEKWYEENNKE